MTAIYKRELGAFFKGPIGWAVTAITVFILGVFAAAMHFAGGNAGFEYTLYNACFLYLILVPVLTMRSLAEEKKQKTDALLYSLPLSSTKIVLGKYLATLTVLALPLVLISPLPLILCLYGTPNLSLAYTALLGFFLLGAALTALGLLVSALTENQIVCALISFLVLLAAYFMQSLAQLVPESAGAGLAVFSLLTLAAAGVLYLLTKRLPLPLILFGLGAAAEVLIFFLAPQLLEKGLVAVVGSLAAFDRFYPFISGILDLTALGYYLSVCGVFLTFTVLAVEKRRWC